MQQGASWLRAQLPAADFVSAPIAFAPAFFFRHLASSLVVSPWSIAIGAISNYHFLPLVCPHTIRPPLTVREGQRDLPISPPYKQKIYTVPLIRMSSPRQARARVPVWGLAVSLVIFALVGLSSGRLIVFQSTVSESGTFR